MHYTFYNKIRTVSLVLSALFCATFLFSQTQTQTMVQKFIFKSGNDSCKGYLESLPVTYDSEPSKKFPLLIFMHGSGGTGDGSTSASTGLPRIINEGGKNIPKKIDEGSFPSSFTIDNQQFSFIVISPQCSGQGAGAAIMKATIDTCVKKYRVDTSRIYITGLSLGGANANGFMSGVDISYTNRIAAALPVCPSNVNPTGTPSFSVRGNRIGSSNLPVWIISNYGDNNTPRNNLKLYVDTINQFSPIPRAKLNIIDSSAGNKHDAWTNAYNQANTWNGLNVYQWMLQYTNKKLVVNAGLDQAITFPGNSTITLNGTKSTARQGRITAWLWTKISGPSSGSITNNTDSITTITGIDTGAYRFELKVTHTDGSTARDTVLVSTQTQTKISKLIHKFNPNDTVIGGFLQSLPVNYDVDTAKKYPLLIFLHAVEEMGNGSTASLDTVTKRGIPGLIREGKFPAEISISGKNYSFIVVSPQFKKVGGATIAIKAMIDSCKKMYRVDTSRMYITGMSQGGILAWGYVGDSGYNKMAATLLVRPTHGTPLVMGAGRVANVQSANLPIWVSSNYNDPVSYTSRANMKLFVDSINLTTPPSPAARLTILDTAAAASTDAWTKTYNPLTKFWISSDSLNVYQWMLKYTRPQGLPRKSQLSVDTALVKEDDTKMLDAVLNPNPVRSNVTVWITGKAKGKASITLYSLQGQRLSQQQFIKNTDEKMSRTINVSRFSGGTYVVQVIVGNKHKRVLQFIKL